MPKGLEQRSLISVADNIQNQRSIYNLYVNKCYSSPLRFSMVMPLSDYVVAVQYQLVSACGGVTNSVTP